MKILFLCTGNRCRSQMAEGFLKALDSSLTVCSAGTFPAKNVHPTAIEVMKERGVDISLNKPKNVSQYLDTSWDYVVTVCDKAKESCPIFLGGVKNRIHLGFDDPDAFRETETEILQEFRRVRDEIDTAVRAFYDTIIHR